MVDPQLAADYANQIGAGLFETSAKTGKGVEDLFSYGKEIVVLGLDLCSLGTYVGMI